MADKGPYRRGGGKIREGTPELCRKGGMPSGNQELNRGSGMPPVSSELCRPGKIPATMPELDRGGFSGGSFVDRTAQNEAARSDWADHTTDFIPGHKRMAGMP
jgi:hypothetical protein